LVKLLLRGPLTFGYRTNLWTTTRIAELIKAQFGVRYHRAHVGRLMHSLNWSHQKPERRAIERKEKAIRRWKRKGWARVKKTLLGWAPTWYSRTNRDSS
jgi:transposase